MASKDNTMEDRWLSKRKYGKVIQKKPLDGFGSYQWSNGNYYEGNWRNGKMCGYGTLRCPGGQTYTGMFKDDKKNGEGTLECNKKDFS